MWHDWPLPWAELMHAGFKPEVVSCSHQPAFVLISQTAESSQWLCGIGY